jgi:hypothetical protein
MKKWLQFILVTFFALLFVLFFPIESCVQYKNEQYELVTHYTNGLMGGGTSEITQEERLVCVQKQITNLFSEIQVNDYIDL